MNSNDNADAAPDAPTPEQITTAALPAYERFKSHGRIAGDDLLLHKFGEIATPAAWLELLRDRNRLHALIDGASDELPDHRRSGEAIEYDEYVTLREAATLTIAKERTRAEAAEAELAAARAKVYAECAKICRDIDTEYASVFAEACAEAIELAAKRTP